MMGWGGQGNNNKKTKKKNVRGFLAYQRPYIVHLLHSAVAFLSLLLLEIIATDVALFNACETAPGYTLLHIACLPLDERCIQLHSKAIDTSIHETRNLSELDGKIKDKQSSATTNNYIDARKVLDAMDKDYRFLTDSIYPVSHQYSVPSSGYHEAQTLVVPLFERHDVSEFICSSFSW